MDGKARILFVDDEKRVLNSMRGLFRREFELFLTTDGSDAIRIASEYPIDVVVADQRMPGMTGIEVLGKVKELSPNTVRILLTGYADPEAVEGSINIGEVFRFLSKPCPPKTLRETLKLAVEASRIAVPPVTPVPSHEPKPAEAARGPQASLKDAAESDGVSELSTGRFDASQSNSAPPSDVAPSRAVPDVAMANAPGTDDAETESAHQEINSATGSQKKLETTAEPPVASADSDRWAIRKEAAEKTDTARDLPTLEPVSPNPENLARLTERADEQREQAAPAATTRGAGSPSHWDQSTTIVLSGDTSHEFRAPNFDSVTSSAFSRVGVVFFTVDPEFAETAMRAASEERSVALATTLAKVAETIERKEAGVLVTDFTSNSSVLQRMLSTLKQLMPELVTIVASSSRDTTDMISLINHGQVFRYILKPIEPKKLMYEINAASIKHLDLAQSPELAKRHRVVDMSRDEKPEETLNKFVTRIRRLRTAGADPTDSST
ncbi:MAG: response regulator [Woeseiaceae bacterium]